MSVGIQTSAAYDYFANRWKVDREVAKNTIHRLIYGSSKEVKNLYDMSDAEKSCVWAFLHGYNARDVRPKNVP